MARDQSLLLLRYGTVAIVSCECRQVDAIAVEKIQQLIFRVYAYECRYQRSSRRPRDDSRQ